MSQPFEPYWARHPPHQSQQPHPNMFGHDFGARAASGVFGSLEERLAADARDNEQFIKAWRADSDKARRELEERWRRENEQFIEEQRQEEERCLREHEQLLKKIEERRQQEERRGREFEEKLRKNQEDIRRLIDDLNRLLEKTRNHTHHKQRQRQPSISRAWTAYEAQRLSLPPKLKFRTILWPVLTPPRVSSRTPGVPPVIKGLTRRALRDFLLSPTHSLNMSDRAKIHAALLRWHPDKMGRVMERVVEKDRSAVEEGVKLVVGELAILLREVSESRKA